MKVDWKETQLWVCDLSTFILHFSSIDCRIEILLCCKIENSNYFGTIDEKFGNKSSMRIIRRIRCC